MLARVSLVLSVVCLQGCLMPPSAAERVTDAARELNIAARFGRMDIAMARAAPDNRRAFLTHRQAWGKTLRIVDLELTGLVLDSSGKTAVVDVDVAWVGMNDATLRTTRLTQTWKNDRAGWRLAEEKRKGGDYGLLGEPIQGPPPGPKRDVHFASRTLSGQPGLESESRLPGRDPALTGRQAPSGKQSASQGQAPGEGNTPDDDSDGRSNPDGAGRQDTDAPPSAP